ncbi:unnamed protein product [Rangifer tarandus platyrhynchus]|uniref:Uncharacterized protein n=1 Tax=Rangifer tarandus platyrhynchus TaxID=3082113 RepID=A0AC59ZLI1_RANTA
MQRWYSLPLIPNSCTKATSRKNITDAETRYLDPYIADVLIHCSDPPSAIKDLFPELLGVLLEAGLTFSNTSTPTPLPWESPRLKTALSSKITSQGCKFLGQFVSKTDQ